MWVRSQDKKQILNVTGLAVGKVFGGKKKGTITAHLQSSSVLESGMFILAQYDTVEDAMREMDRFEEHLEDESSKIFKFR